MSFIQKAKAILQARQYKICEHENISSGAYQLFIYIEDIYNQSLVAKIVQIAPKNQSQQWLESINILATKKQVLEQANLLNSTSHQNVVRFQEHFIEEDISFLIMERSYENLNQYLRKHYSQSPPNEKQFLKIMIQLVDGLTFLYDQKFIIHDIKLENIQVFENDLFKYSDFEISERDFTDDEISSNQQRNIIGNTLSYLPKDYFNFDKAQNEKDYFKKNSICESSKGDEVQALGIALLQVLGKNHQDLLDLQNEEVKFDDFNHIGNDIKEILKWMITKNEQQHPTVKEVQIKLKKIILNRKSEKYRKKAMSLYLKDLDYTKATEYFQKAIELDAENSYAYSSYAFFLYRVYRDECKEEMYKNVDLALNLNQNNQEAQLLKNFRIENTKERIKQKEKLNQSDPVVLTSIGTDYYEDVQYDMAERFYLKSIEKYPNYGRSYYNLGLLYHQILKNNEQAIKTLLQGLNRDLSNSLFLNEIATIYKNNNNFELAEEYFKKSINSNCKDSNSYFDYGDFLQYDKKDLSKALQMYQQSIKINPKKCNSYYEIGKTYNKLDNNQKSEQYLKKAIQINPQYMQAHRYLMIILSDCPNYLERKGEISYHFKQAKKIDPTDSTTYNLYAEILENKYLEYDKAFQYFKEGYKVQPNEQAQQDIQSLKKKI